MIDAGETNSNGIQNGSEVRGDTIDYSSNGATKIVVDLDTVDAQDYATVTVSGTNAANDKVKDIENITGTAGNDTILGNADANTLLGMAGNDSLDGKAGIDYIDGGAGNDTITGGSGADKLFGSSGNDIFVDIDFTADSIDGGNEDDSSRGSDTIDYSSLDTTSMVSGISVTLNDSTIATVTVNSDTTNHTIVNIEIFMEQIKMII